MLNTDAEPEELRDFLASLASYVLACDVTLQDGETIGFSADDKHTITRSPVSAGACAGGDVTLQDGETIGFSADDKHTITRTPVSLCRRSR